MLAKDKARLGTIRLLMAEIKQREVDTRVELDDQEILAVVTKMVKQRRDSISQFGSSRSLRIRRQRVRRDRCAAGVPAAAADRSRDCRTD